MVAIAWFVKTLLMVNSVGTVLDDPLAVPVAVSVMVDSSSLEL